MTRMFPQPERKEESFQPRYQTELVGARVRELRLQRKLTISRLAELSSVPSSTISKIENGQLRPSLVHSINLASALQANLGFLVEGFRDQPHSVCVVRANERNTIHYPDMGLTLQDLSGNFYSGVLEARLGILKPDAHSGLGGMRHPSEEICYVLAGAMRYQIGDQVYDLAVGDYIHIKSMVEHSWENAHGRETRVLWVFSDNLSF
jgi:transcriptional regulator with XRE-family HTH domain